MEKLLNFFGLTTLKQAQIKTDKAVNQAVETILGEKPYKRVLDFVRHCRKYRFKVVAVDIDSEEALKLSRDFAEKAYYANTSEQNEFASQFMPHVKPVNDMNLLK